MSVVGSHRLFSRVATYLGAVVVVVVMGFPLYGIVLTSIQEETDIRSRDVQFIPSYVDTEHYQAIFAADSAVPVREAMVNSLVVSLVAAFVAVGIALPASYGLTRLWPRGGGVLLGGLAAIYVFPTLLFVIPIFVVWVRIGLFDTYLGLVIPYVAFLLPFVVLVLGAFLRSIPVEIEDAARIDGANLFRLFTGIVIPLMGPGILAALLFGFILSWVEFLTPLLFTSDLTLLTVALGLFRSTIDIKIGQLAAATVVTALPVVVLTVVFNRQLVQAITVERDY